MMVNIWNQRYTSLEYEDLRRAVEEDELRQVEATEAEWAAAHNVHELSQHHSPAEEEGSNIERLTWTQ